MIETEVLIVGGGLCGLSVADRLSILDRDWQLLEARDRWGGRVCSAPYEQTPHKFDLGPSWIWPHNDRMLQLCQRFNVDVFEQFATGTLVYEDEGGHVRRDLTFSTMAGALRLEGGIASLVDGYLGDLSPAKRHLKHRVVRINLASDFIEAAVETPDGQTTFLAERCVLSLPPRVIGETITFEPTLAPSATNAMGAVPTWMAGHAKAVFVYDRPFWREMGLSGDAISRPGPMIEIHDASPNDASVGALFGFVGAPPTAREGHEKELIEACVDQLSNLFGEKASKPSANYFTDWAFQPETATRADHTLPLQHPHYALPPELVGLWEDRLVFAGTETATVNGGFLEGALEAAEAAVERL